MNTTQLPNTFRTKPKTRTGSAFLFRESYNCLIDALFMLFRIELPAKWWEFKDNNIAEFHSSVAEDEQDKVGDILSVLMLCLLVIFGLGVVWIWWILTH